MRLTQRSAFGFIFGGGFAIAGGLAGAACSSDDFNGCAAARNCASSPAGAGGLASAGHGGEAAGGKAGQGGAGAVAGRANGGKGAVVGTGGNGDAGSPDAAGSGNGQEPSGSGGTHAGSSADGGTGGPEPVRPTGTGGSKNSSNEVGAGMGGEAAEPGRDTKAPSLVMVTTQGSTTPWPNTGAKGVKDDDVIVLVFDEPMAPSTAGYASTDLPPDAVNFTWDDTKTRLAIKPLAPLKYAQVSDPTATGQQYVFAIGTGFHDLEGNALASSQTIVFTTLRHVTHSLAVAPGGGTVITQPAAGMNTTSVRCESANDHVTAGVDGTMETLFSVVVFNLSSLPDGIEWNSATLAGTLGASVTNPYGDTRFGALHAYTTNVTPNMATWDSVETDLGLFSTYASQTHGAIDVTAALAVDYRNRVTARNASEFVFRFDRQTETADISDHDQLAYIYCDDLKLELDYSAP